MIHFEGEQLFNRPVSEVYTRLSDAEFLAKGLTDVEVKETSPDKSVWKMRPKFSFIRTTLETTLTVRDRVPDKSTKLQLYSAGIGASSTVDIVMNFEATDQGTRVKWTGDIVQLTGLLKLVPKGLVQSSASRVIEEVWSGVEKAMA